MDRNVDLLIAYWNWYRQVAWSFIESLVDTCQALDFLEALRECPMNLFA